MIKLLGIFITLISAAAIGFIYAGIFSSRVKQLREMEFSIHMLETEVVYASTPLCSAFALVAAKSKLPISRLYEAMWKALEDKTAESVFDAFKISCRINKDTLNLKREEIEVLNCFMKNLGASDIEGQKKNFNLTVKKLEDIEKNAEEIWRKNEKLYRYLGFCGGALLVIILI